MELAFIWALIMSWVLVNTLTAWLDPLKVPFPVNWLGAPVLGLAAPVLGAVVPPVRYWL